MTILHQLGLNQSFFFQFIIFAIAYLVLSQIVFAPYTKAFTQREEKTKGGEELAGEYKHKADELKAQYENRARQVSGQVKTIFDEYRSEANKECEQIVSQARSESQKIIEAARQKVHIELSEAEKKMKSEIPLVAQEITQRLLVK
ncbi:MAG: hypothetical protein COT73_04250 [Bdellovibrio sp. CG10_big_fil_rev_8_21_14_0_10_47_8]|nr:MAG: hypothetical protein COT73_04250 [Bdellovibrio sp. CG10_big_fil_rev_8_21_14_0_10_47_8]